MESIKRILQILEEKSKIPKSKLNIIVKMEWEKLSQIMASGEEAIQSELKKALIADKKTKKRWVQKEEDGGGPFEKEMDEAFQVLAGADGVQAFQKKYKAKDYHEYRKTKLQELYDWVENEEELCCQFKYFSEKKRWQRESALKTDIRLLSLKEMLSDKNSENQKPVVSQLNSWVVAVDPTSKALFPEPDDGESTRVLTINLPGGTSIRQELALEEAKGDVYSSQMVQKLMNTWDLSVLRFVLHKLAEQKYRGAEITTTRKEILDFINEPANGRNYEVIEASIKKLVALTIFINSPGSNFSLRFLEGYDMLKHGSTETLNITLNKDVYTQALNGKITSMYKDVIDSLSGAAAAMIYRLQRLRIQKHYSKESPIVIVDMDFFRSILILNSKRKDRMYKAIESSLDEIVEMGVTLKNYTKITDGVYELEFLPLSTSEINDLGTYNTNTEQFVFPTKMESLDQ